MNKNRFFMLTGLILAFLPVMHLYPREYIYPLATYTDCGHEILLFAHQNSNQQVGLWSFDKETQSYEQLVASRYNPVGVTLLPDTSGFSFLDNGLIRVKHFVKRSPQTIEIYEPVYNIGAISWLDDTTCLFHAKKGNRYGIYTTDLDGQCAVVLESKSSDYLYPSYINNILFFIERDLGGNHSVQYITPKSLLKSDKEAAVLVHNFAEKTMVKLVMRNEQEGFLVEYVSTSNQNDALNPNDAVMIFSFYKFASDVQGAWHTKKLFTFSLPTCLFVSTQDTMHDAMRDPMPALFPLVTPDAIYFISLESDQKIMSLYSYDERTDSVALCTSDNSLAKQYVLYAGLPDDGYGHILMPRMVDGTLVSGYSLNQ